MPCPDIPAIDEERWIEGNGGLIRFYSQGPVEANRFSPEGIAAESLIENWWLRRYYDRDHMSYRLDLVCNRMNFHGIPIDFCQFDLAGLDRRISGEGTYLGQHIDRHEDRIIQVDARSLVMRDDGPRSYGPLNIQIGSEAGHTPGAYYGIDRAGTKLEVNKKAEELLLSFLDSKQQQDYRKLGHFGYIEKDIRREWKFHFRYHYPVEFRCSDSHYECNQFIGLCIELKNETPKEDVLLMSLLEVRGGRGDNLIKAGHRNPRPLRNDQRLHPGGSPDFQRAMQRLSGAARRAVISAERFREQIREQVSRNFRMTPEQFATEENRGTATEARDIAPPLTLERLQRLILNIASTPRITKVSCSPEAYEDLIRRNDIALDEGVSVNIANNNLYIGSLWGIEFYVDPDQREPFRPIGG